MLRRLFGSEPARHPCEDLVIPLNRVLGLEHPMALVRKDQEPRWDVPALERGKSCNPLRVRNSKVVLAGDHELGRFPVLNVVHWVPPLELLRSFVIRMAAMLPFVEP